jgi:hypothetical protein
LNFSEERKLATTTGGEPVHSDARENRNGIVHEADFTTAPKAMQGSPPQICSSTGPSWKCFCDELIGAN